ncbi:LysR family transcriptional regulator [Kitasatospora viridis]|uniref:DNA-binding transcriptional LysR family regulator n=1 Tax=Kitasatospora viridis TaxID=281105 RepID=A0A561SFH5_9ACTN|nr:LysR substrate-binding domain-containing protein [Kitasatospora viridis]TWF73631.1 DNA-binding transcriptional LysR family regulator [Kitasatospora viridis]
MTRTLDIAVLRSMVAIAENGGFHRAAGALDISQSAVSQHVRRLERIIGRPLVERHGRGIRFTSDGEVAVTEARRVLAAHDEALVRLGLAETDHPGYLIGTTEHAAEGLLPVISRTLGTECPGQAVRFRLDRSTALHEAIDRGTVDAAVFIGNPGHRQSVQAGEVRLSWFAAPEWRVPDRTAPIPLVAIDGPCVLRDRATAALEGAGRTVTVIAEAAQFTGVVSAVRAGLGISLLADHGPLPAGLVRIGELPEVPPERLYLRHRPGAPWPLTRALRTALDSLGLPDRADRAA